MKGVRPQRSYNTSALPPAPACGECDAFKPPLSLFPFHFHPKLGDGEASHLQGLHLAKAHHRPGEAVDPLPFPRPAPLLQVALKEPRGKGPEGPFKPAPRHRGEEVQGGPGGEGVERPWR